MSEGGCMIGSPQLSALAYLKGNDSTGLLLASTHTKLDSLEYSRFKYGDGAVARDYGDQLARLALKNSALRRWAGPLVVTSSAFDVVPTAAHSMVAPFAGILS